MTYQVEVYECGAKVATFDGIEADDAKQAADRIELKYGPKVTQFLRDCEGKLIEVTCVLGFEFRVRSLGMTLS